MASVWVHVKTFIFLEIVSDTCVDASAQSQQQHEPRGPHARNWRTPPAPAPSPHVISRSPFQVAVNFANWQTRMWKFAPEVVGNSEFLLHTNILTIIRFDEDIFAGGNCYDAGQYGVRDALINSLSDFPRTFH